MAGTLGVFDCAGVADGGAAAIVVRAEDAAKYTDKPLYVKALSLVAGNGSGLSDPNYDYTTFPEVVDSAEDAYRQAGITDPRSQLAMAEVHDCFTPTEMVLMEDLGFAERGTAWKEILAGTFDLDGDLPVNPDGGLKSFGHPVGASGLRMMFECWLQLRGEAPGQSPPRQRPQAGAHAQPRWLPGRDGVVRVDPRNRAWLTSLKVGDVANEGAAQFGKPLDGIRVLAAEQMQALPYATQLLARLGADVVKVEPLSGESGRGAQPSMRDPDGRVVGATFLRNNLGKRSIALDLKSERGRDLFLRLVPRFDVVAENFKAGTMDRFGLGYDVLAARHPAVIYLSISGFGASGSPYSSWPAYAPIVEAMSGIYEYLNPTGQPPRAAPVGALGDISAALFATIGVLAALRHRDATGEGQQVDIAMYDTAVAMTDIVMNLASLGQPKQPFPKHFILDTFRAADGWFVMQTRARAPVRAAGAGDRPSRVDRRSPPRHPRELGRAPRGHHPSGRRGVGREPHHGRGARRSSPRLASRPDRASTRRT